MSTKVFVHKPLKRAEARRLTEEPKPIEAVPRPSLTRLEAKPDPEREARIRERWAERAAERQEHVKLASMTDLFMETSKPMVVPVEAFIRWLLENLTKRDIVEQQAFINDMDMDIMAVYGADMPCVVCGGATHRGAMVLVLQAFPSEHTVGGMLCQQCIGCKPRLLARAIISMVAGNQDHKRLHKLTLAEGDWDFLKWTKERRSDDTKAVTQMIDNGQYDGAMSAIEMVEQLMRAETRR